MLNYNSAHEVWTKAGIELKNPPTGLKVPWWPGLNDLIGGFRPNELTLLCAPTGAGKTQLLANLAAQLAIMGESQFIAPVETGDSDFLIRMISALEKRDLNHGEPVSQAELDILTAKWGGYLSASPILISTHDNRVEVKDMIATLGYMHQEYQCKIAILDNLNFFLKVVSSQQEKAEMDNTIHEFVMLAKNLPMHIILVVHPKKTDGEGRVESEFDIKGSSTAVQEASNVCLFNRPTKKDQESQKYSITDRELVFRKIRKRGVNVGKPLYFGFDNARYREIR